MRRFYSFTINPLVLPLLISNWKAILTTVTLLCGMVFRENLSSPSHYPGLETISPQIEREVGFHQYVSRLSGNNFCRCFYRVPVGTSVGSRLDYFSACPYPFPIKLMTMQTKIHKYRQQTTIQSLNFNKG